MTLQSFVLNPFQSPGQLLPNLVITGQVKRQANALEIRYQVEGDLSHLVMPPKAAVPTRQHHLWQSTCFEVFFGPQQQEFYWEVNLSPSGHWNVYHFDRYRQGMQSEPGITAIPFRSQQSARALQIGLELDLHALVSPEQPLAMAITVVTQSLEGTLTYWALTHPGTEADFHQRDSFTIRV